MRRIIFVGLADVLEDEPLQRDHRVTAGMPDLFNEILKVFGREVLVGVDWGRHWVFLNRLTITVADVHHSIRIDSEEQAIG